MATVRCVALYVKIEKHGKQCQMIELFPEEEGGGGGGELLEIFVGGMRLCSPNPDPI